MRIVYYMTYIMAFVFLVGETSRRGFGYFSINATTMVEDYLYRVSGFKRCYLGDLPGVFNRYLTAGRW